MCEQHEGPADGDHQKDEPRVGLGAVCAHTHNRLSEPAGQRRVSTLTGASSVDLRVVAQTLAAERVARSVWHAARRTLAVGLAPLGRTYVIQGDNSNDSTGIEQPEGRKVRTRENGGEVLRISVHPEE